VFACVHLNYEYFTTFHCNAPFLHHTTFGWYVSIAQLPRCCSCFDRLTVLWCFSLSKLWSYQASISTRQGKSVFNLDGFHRCSIARGTSASSPFNRTSPLQTAATKSLRRVLIIGASLRPKSSRSCFNTASSSSFRIAAIGVRMHGARLQARRSTGRRRFKQRQQNLCGVF